MVTKTYTVSFENQHTFATRKNGKFAKESKQRDVESKTKLWPQFMTATIGYFCAISQGLHFGWSSPSIGKLTSAESIIPITLTEASWITSIQPLGDLIGAPLGTYLCGKIGRKFTIMLCAIPQLIGWIIIGFAAQPYQLIVARFISGISEGAAFTAIPMYLSETTEPRIRGIIGTIFTMMFIVGIFLINIIGHYFDIHTAALISIVAPILTLCSSVCAVESPYFYAARDKQEKLIQALKKLRGTDQIESEVRTILDNVSEQMQEAGSFKILFTNKIYRKAMWICLGLRVFQQLAGISALTYYCQTIFEQSQMDISAFAATVIYLSVQLVMTMFCAIFVDKFGRIPLLIISQIGGGLSLFLLGLYYFLKINEIYDSDWFNYVPIFSMLCYILIFSIGYGAIPNLMISELFPANVKSKAICLLHFVFAFCLFFSGRFFIFLMENFGVYTPFWLYAACCFLGMIFTCKFVPETKNKSLEEIQTWLNGNKR